MHDDIYLSTLAQSAHLQTIKDTKLPQFHDNWMCLTSLYREEYEALQANHMGNETYYSMDQLQKKAEKKLVRNAAYLR